MYVTRQFGTVPTIGIIAAFILLITNVVGADKNDYKIEDKTAFHIILGQRQLFLDNYAIAKIKNLKRTMHQPEKKGAVIRSSNPSQTIQTRTAPIWDPEEKIFKFWVLSTDEVFFTSKDGLNWTPGSKPNINLRMVVRDPNDPDPARRYKGAIGNQGFAVSPDGINWTKLTVPAVPSLDESNFSYNSKAGMFIHMVKRIGPYGRAVAVATSRDFKNWTDYGVVFHADAKDQEIGRKTIEARLVNPTLKQTEYNTPEHYSVQIYNMGVFAYEGMYIGLPSMYHHTGKVPPDWPGFKKMHLSPYIQDCVNKYGDYTGFYNIQLVCSRNLKTWKRLGDRKPFIETSPLDAGAYDLQSIIGPSSPVLRNDELWFYYTGIKQYAFISSGAEPGYDDYFPDAGAICLAVLRRDGFISLDAGEKEGTILTKPFTMPGGKLFVNVDVPIGELRAEILDKNGNVLAASVPMKGDLFRGELQWQDSNIDDFKGKLVSIRFILHNAEFYSYWFDEN